jgi:1-acyl-sn-glycerol-3-phosphate acyltransferase
MRKLASLAIWIFSTLLTMILYFAVLIVTVVLYPFDKKRMAAHAQCYWWSDIIIGFNPYWKMDVSGLENIDKNKTYVIVANHQSLADIAALYKIKTQFKWVAKESLFRVPFVGWCLGLTKHIRIRRGKYSSIKNVYRDTTYWLRQGISVLFFPEGTRAEGAANELNDFFSGAFRLAIKEKVPVLPIMVNGTKDVIQKGSWIFNPIVKCTIRVLPPIDTGSLSTRDFLALKDQTFNKIEAELKKVAA